MSWETTQTLISLTSILITIGILVIIFLIIRGIWRAFKKFIFELIDRANGNGPKTKTNKTNYTYTYNGQKHDDTPPWEK